MTQLNQGPPLAVVADTVLAAEARSELETQMAWAYTHPRDLTRVRREVLALATETKDIAGDCFYSLPAGGKPVEGPYVGLAKLVLSTWKNLHAGARIVEVGAARVVAQGVCYDMETNTRVSAEATRSILTKHGQRFSENLIVKTCGAAKSIAIRNAVFSLIPAAYIDPIWRAARGLAIGDVETLAATRGKMMEYLAKMGVSPERVLRTIGREAVEDVTLDDVGILRGTCTSIREGGVSVDDAFPEIQDTKAKPTTLDAFVDQQAQPQEPAQATEKPVSEPEQVKAAENATVHTGPVELLTAAQVKTPEDTTTPLLSPEDAGRRATLVAQIGTLNLADRKFVLGQRMSLMGAQGCADQAVLDAMQVRLEAVKKKAVAKPADGKLDLEG